MSSSLGASSCATPRPHQELCKSGLPARLLTCRKEGPKKGGKFYCCYHYNGPEDLGCNMFRWLKDELSKADSSRDEVKSSMEENLTPEALNELDARLVEVTTAITQVKSQLLEFEQRLTNKFEAKMDASIVLLLALNLVYSMISN